MLWRALCRRWPQRVRSGDLCWAFTGAVPGRRFRIDIAIRSARLAIESDGWQHHGRYLSDFKRDRAKDKALVCAGWRVLRFFSEEIRGDLEGQVDLIASVLARLAADDGHHP